MRLRLARVADQRRRQSWRAGDLGVSASRWEGMFMLR